MSSPSALSLNERPDVAQHLRSQPSAEAGRGAALGSYAAQDASTRRTAERELQAIGGRREEIEQLERDRDAIKVSWAAAVPGNLDRLTPEGRNELYHKLRLEISPTEDGYEVTGPFCTLEPLPWARDGFPARS